MVNSVSTTASIRKETYDECMKIVESGEFPNISEMVNYSMRFYLYHILNERIEMIPYLPGDDHVYLRIRFDRWCRENMLATGLLSKGDLAEYSLSFFLKYRRDFSPIEHNDEAEAMD